MLKTVYEGSCLANILYIGLLVGALCGLLTTWNGFFLASSQLMMAMSRARMIPKCFEEQHKKFNTPVNGLTACLVISCIGPFMGAGIIDYLTSFSSASYVISWALTAMSLIALRRKEPFSHRPYRIPGGVFTAGFAGICMAILFILMLIPQSPTFLGSVPIILLISWYILGFVLHLITNRTRKEMTESDRSEEFFGIE